jgi:uncharacterized secreted protein with C-terminal beta-propeller domain
MKIATVALLAIFLVGIVLVSGCLSSEESTSTSNSGQSGSDTTMNLKIGETAQTTKREVTVYSVQKSSTYTWRGSSSGNIYTETAPPGKIYIMANVQVKNIGSDSLYASGGDFSIADSNGFKYDQSYASIDNEFHSQELFPNQRTSGIVMFEVPINATNLKLVYDFGSFGSVKLAIWSLPV